jgi:hypothetical protein
MKKAACGVLRTPTPPGGPRGTRGLWSIALLTSTVVVCSACAGVAPPTERLTEAEAAIRGALEVEAGTIPRAQLHVKLAQEQVEKAKRYIQDEQNERADMAVRRAQADAELAIALAREHEMTSKAKVAQARVAKLRAGRGR